MISALPFSRRCGAICLFWGLILMWWMPAIALERGMDLDVSVQEEYNDNIFLTVDDAIEDAITTIAGGLTLYNRTERADGDIAARVERLYYRDQDELNATDQFYSGKVNYHFSPRWQAGLKAGFSRDSRPDRDVAVTGLVQGTDEREKLDAGANTSYSLSENTAVSLSYSYADEDYERNEFSDMTSHQAALGFNHNIGRYFANTSLQFNLNYGRYEYDAVEVVIYAGTIGFVKEIAELWSLTMSGGARYQETELDIAAGLASSNEDNWGTVWSVGVDYKGEYARFGLSGWQAVMPSSGLDGTTERTSLDLKLYYHLAPKSGAGLNVSYFINNADPGQLAAEHVDEETWRISPYIKLSIVDDLYLIARYSYSQIYDRADDTTISRKLALLQLAYEWPVW
jgi:hypothetical protein